MTYDHFLPSNVHFPAKHDRQENIAWTDAECKKAELGNSLWSIEDFCGLVGILITHSLGC